MLQIPAHGAQPFVIVDAHKINVEMGNVLQDASAIKKWTANADLSGVAVGRLRSNSGAGGIQVRRREDALKMEC